jgi:hypothetical protein
MIRHLLGRGLLAALVVGAVAALARAQDAQPSGVTQSVWRDRAPAAGQDCDGACGPQSRARLFAKGHPEEDGGDHDDGAQPAKRGVFGWGWAYPPGRPVPILGWLGGSNFAWTTHNELNTANFRSEYVFLWGASRTFFGEPYVKGPPIYPFPVWPSYQTAPGYPGYLGYEGHPEYPIRNTPPGYPCQPYPPNTPVPHKGDCAGVPTGPPPYAATGQPQYWYNLSGKHLLPESREE